ncbi:MAG: thioredoxin family protein [Phycisphaerales bacterium JB039]
MISRTLVALIIAAAAAAPAVAQNETVPALKLVKPGEAQAAQAQPEKPPLYDEQADGREQIAAALAKAKKENQRVLIQWGGNWCGWCIKLDELCKSDPAIRRKLMYEYQVVHIDTGRAGKNVDLANAYGAEVQKHGYPFLTVLDASGRAIANQETSSLEEKDEDGKVTGKHMPDAVLGFLEKHQAQPLNASEVLAAGLEAAQRNAEAGKGPTRVFLHFGAPWCGWCHRLEDWMARDQIGALLGKDFVDVKIDTDRMIGGAEALTKYRGSERGGIPWFVILDAEGKPLITSDGPDGNVGFPVQPEEIAHFEAMLRTSATHLSAQQIDTLIASLRESAKTILGG